MDENGNGVKRELTLSKQARFGATSDIGDIAFSIVNWGISAALEDVTYQPNSRARDKWLREFVRKEPNLMGVMNAVVDIDKNRGWRMVGGRNQVKRFTEMLHDFEAAPGLTGWRPSMSFQSKSFWGADIGAVTELGRDGIDGPVRKLYTTDPALCALTGKPNFPLEFMNAKTKAKMKWRAKDFFRVTSLVDNDETYNGLGYCAVSRALELTRLMIAVYEHDFETLGAKAPRGLLVVTGIGKQQFEDAMKLREEEAEGAGFDYFDAVAVLANKSEKVDAKLVALSQLPTSFNLREWLDMVMYGYALCFGYDPSEFWPVQFGALGRGTETEVQSEKASAKGKLDFALGFQEQLQQFLPDTLEFLFDQRDDKGDLLKAQVNQAKIAVVKSMYETGLAQGAPLLDRVEARIILADYGLIPREWAELESQSATDQQDEEGSIDLEDKPSEEPAPLDQALEGEVSNVGRASRMLRDRLLSSDRIFRAASKFKDEPIVEYSWPDNTFLILSRSGAELLRRRMR